MLGHPDNADEEFVVNDLVISRQSIAISMRDGARLRGFCYSRPNLPARGRNLEKRLKTPLLCLADELGNTQEHHTFILTFMAQSGAPEKTYCFDLRGRGMSDDTNIGDSDLDTDCDDLISLCDALNLHHADFLVSGRGIHPLLLTAPKRPGMVRRLVLNDAAPEFDAVGIARLSAVSKRLGVPGNWAEATSQIKKLKVEEFPDFDDDQWLTMAKTIWHDDQGKPVPSIAKGLSRLSNSTDYDSKQPAMWAEFKLLQDRPALLIRGEKSILLSEDITTRIQHAHKALEVISVPNQGHVPQLKTGDLPEHILRFLTQD